ncbi:MAG: hypothetical protein R3B94_03810 [Hyphomonas sp.]
MIRFMKWSAAALAGLSISACASQPEATSADMAAECGAPAGWESIAEASEHKVLIFGESHGTNEMPDAFARYVCAASAQGGKTLVLLEIDTSYEDTFSEASDAADPHAVLVTEMPKYWSSTDGRGSVAMLDMVERLITLRQAGRDVTIGPMDQMTGWPDMKSPEELSVWLASQPPTKAQQMRDAGMAEKIRAESEGFDRTIVLVGNVHAREAELKVLPGVQLMAMLVPDAISLFGIYDGGTSWSNRDGLTGSVSEMYRLNLIGAPADAMALTPERLPAYPGDVPAYDGYFSVGMLSASEPVLPSVQ